MAFDEYIKPVTSGNYTVRLCENEEEVKQYQDLRYKYLILEFDPSKSENSDRSITDENIGYDKTTSQICAFFHNPETGKTEVVGGYILMRFKKEDDFCKATLKYDLSNLLRKHKFEVVELSRAVMHPDHRNGFITKLLWNGIWDYVLERKLRFLFGTMSFKGLDPLKYLQAASYLHYNYKMAEDIMVRPIEEHAFYHEYLKKDEIDRKTAIGQIPPLLKGLLMIGAKTGDGFYIDNDLGVVETFAIIDNFNNQHNLNNFGKQEVL